MRKIYAPFTLSILFASSLLFSCAAKKETNSSSVKLEEKYARMLGVDEKEISNTKLYSFIDEWYGVKYKYAGKTKSGVGCSGFTGILEKEVFAAEASGSSASMYNQCEKISKKDLKEGDLIFFKIGSKDISHVGVYLRNNKFVHASLTGVKINDLNEEYYVKYFEGAGRIK